MDKKSVAAASLMLLLLGYALCNLAVNWPYFRFAVESGWDAASRMERLNSVVNAQAAGQEALLSAFAHGENLLGKRVSGDLQIWRDEEGFSHYINFFPYESYDYTHYALRLSALQAIAEEGGGRLLFLAATNSPRKQREETFPIADFGARSDAMMYFLQGLGVPCLDSRDILAEIGFDEGSYRYRSDARWRVEACFAVFSGLLAELRESGLDLDPEGFYADADNYYAAEYPGGFSGDFARQAGIPFTGMDDFTLYIPAFDTDFSVETTQYGVTRRLRGDFAETLLQSAYLEAEEPYARNLFRAYFGGQAPLRVITNHLAPKGPKILLIGDDYSAPLAAFLAPLAGELHYVWPYAHPLVQDIEGYMAARDFDLVLVEVSPHNMTAEGLAILD